MNEHHLASYVAGDKGAPSLRQSDHLVIAQAVVREMAHRLNNALAVAIGYVEVAQDDPLLPTTTRESLETAKAALDRAAADIRQFQRLRRLVLVDSPMGSMLDLDSSIDEPDLQA